MKVKNSSICWTLTTIENLFQFFNFKCMIFSLILYTVEFEMVKKGTFYESIHASIPSLCIFYPPLTDRFPHLSTHSIYIWIISSLCKVSGGCKLLNKCKLTERTFPFGSSSNHKIINTRNRKQMLSIII